MGDCLLLGGCQFRSLECYHFLGGFQCPDLGGSMGDYLPLFPVSAQARSKDDSKASWVWSKGGS